MAEGKGKDESYASWFGGLLAAAKEKSEKAFEMVCNDLDEFTSTMQKDTKKVVDQTKQTLQNEESSKTATDKLKTGFTSLMDGITKVLTVEPEDTSPPKTKTQPAKPDEAIFDRSKARIRAIQVDTGTYLNEPTGPRNQFIDWTQSFDLDSKKGDISDLLITMVEVRSLYATLVPSQVSHQEFWQRYFYKVHQLELDEARKQALMRRADNAQVKEESISWDDEEWSADEDQSTPRNQEEIDNRLHADSDALEVLETEKNSGTVKTDTENQSVDGSKNIPAINEEKSETQSTTLKDKDTGQSDDVQTKIDKNTDTDNDETKTDGTNAIEKESVTETSESMEKDKVAESESVEKDKTTESATISVDSDKVPVVSKDSVDGKVCDKEDIVGEEAEFKTRVKGDMVVVGTERISPSSDLSGTGTKESSTGSEDWEQDFDIELTEEDIKAAEEVARKLNVSSKDYTKLAGEQNLSQTMPATTPTCENVTPTSEPLSTILSVSAASITDTVASTTIASATCTSIADPVTAAQNTDDSVTNNFNDDDWENWE